MKTLKDLQKEIAELKDGRTIKEIKADDVKLYYTIQGLTKKVSELKAIEKGQFITKNDLTEYKGLIIFLIKKTNYKNTLTIKEAMQAILDKVENENIVYITKKGIKGIIADLTKRTVLHAVWEKRFDAINDNSMNNSDYNQFQQFRIKQLM